MSGMPIRIVPSSPSAGSDLKHGTGAVLGVSHEHAVAYLNARPLVYGLELKTGHFALRLFDEAAEAGAHASP